MADGGNSLGAALLDKHSQEKLQSDGHVAGCGWRHVAVGFVLLLNVVCYADRTNIGIVLAHHDFQGIPHDDKGIILSAFFVGYFFSQIPGGILARRWGAKPVFVLAALTWSICDVLTPWMAILGLAPLIAVRIGMGLGEGLVLPAQQAFANFWIPQSERAFLVCAMVGGQESGSVLANVISPWLLRLGITQVFVFWGFAAVLWVGAFVSFGASAPELHTACMHSGEAAWIMEDREAPHINQVSQARTSESVLLLRLLKEPCVWAIFVAHFGVNYSWYVVLSWMPSFYVEVHNLDLAKNTHLLAIPYMAGFIGMIFMSRMSDALIARGARIRHVRKLAQTVGVFGFTFFLLLAPCARSSHLAGLWMALALFCGRMQTAGFLVNITDICPESAGTTTALSNTIATLAGIIAQPITQAVLDTSYSWSGVYGICGAVGITATLFFILFADDASLDTRSPNVRAA